VWMSRFPQEPVLIRNAADVIVTATIVVVVAGGSIEDNAGVRQLRRWADEEDRKSDASP
jgi:hypothetical protein